MLWQKLYVMQRERCDWPDVLNLIYAVGARLDWRRLLARMGDDWPLLAGVLSVYDWLCPERAAQLPGWVRDRFGMAAAGPCSRSRADLLDRRPWFPIQIGD